MGKIRAIDLFCGAGGSSWGAKCAGVEIVAGVELRIFRYIDRCCYARTAFYCR